MERKQAAGKVIQFDQFTAANGQQAMAARMTVNDLASVYLEHDNFKDCYNGVKWNSTGGNFYFPTLRMYTPETGVKALDSFVFPAEDRARAARASESLVQAFEQVASLKYERNQSTGRLDRSKFSQLAMAGGAGWDIDQTRPYRRMVEMPVKTPTIALVASGSPGEMWGDAHYIPRVTMLTLAVQWACEAANLNSFAAITAGEYDKRHSPTQPLINIMLAEPNRVTPLKNYGIMLHRDMFRLGMSFAFAADYDGTQRVRKLTGSTDKYPGNAYSADDGGYAVRWARESLGADVVIAIGSIRDKGDADVSLTSTLNLEQAVKSIAQQADKLRG